MREWTLAGTEAGPRDLWNGLEDGVASGGVYPRGSVNSLAIDVVWLEKM